MNAIPETLVFTWSDSETGASHTQEITPPATIGRGSDATVRLTDREVSRLHARLERVEGGFVLIDTSANGILVNGQRQKRAMLSHGALLQIGPYHLRVQIVSGMTVEGSPAVLTQREVTVASPAVLTQREVTVASPAVLTQREVTVASPAVLTQREIKAMQEMSDQKARVVVHEVIFRLREQVLVSRPSAPRR